jgi:transcriptional regulator with XRE-family HTH domain
MQKYLQIVYSILGTRLYNLYLLVVGLNMVQLKSVLASNIKAHRKSRNLTQENLAEKVGTAPTYIAMIESGRRTPSFKMIERIAEVFRVDAPELFSMKSYPAESALELRRELTNQFDKFLRAAAKEIREKER